MLNKKEKEKKKSEMEGIGGRSGMEVKLIEPGGGGAIIIITRNPKPPSVGKSLYSLPLQPLTYYLLL